MEFLPEALIDAEEATRFYDSRVPGLGRRFRVELENICGEINRQPLLWNERAGGYRRANLSRFPHYVAYFLREGRIVIAAIGHVSRHPDYWKKRLL